ncbi:EH signature domain-containing protein [Paraglaciecola sp. 20A4]|uniref:EH signature domain-containing protein n=1 Tax=Paraglaciecola sp. 20A4 TaxID=2687288 RepID=UPI00140E8C78|nr:EH signature domain-containing protein [Paraglaciecola sp. 20A4]
MFAKAALRSLEIESWSTPPVISESLLIKASNDITKVSIENDLVVPTRTTLLQIYKRLKLAFENKDLTTLSRYDIYHSPWVLFEQFDDEKALIKRWRFWAFYKKLTQNVDNYRFVLAFYNAYLVLYPFEQKYIVELQSHIKSLFKESNNRKVFRVSAEILGRQTLDSNAHIVISQNIAVTGNVGSELRTRGLLEGLSASKFTVKVLSEYLENFQSFIDNIPSDKQMNMIAKLVKFAELNGKLTYPEFRIEIANSILIASGSIELRTDVKDSLKTFFLTHFGDPRVELTGWHGVDDEAIRVFQSWLVEKTMEDFFNLLSHVADQSDADRHWKYRKRFWNAYLKKGYIEEAWFALGVKSFEQAPNFIKGRHNYASLSGGDSKHSVLIMKIGDLIVTEWSHSGSYRVWNSPQFAPTFYSKHYSRDDVILNSDHTGAHHGNIQGGWQQKLSGHIRDLTGFRVTERDYMND